MGHESRPPGKAAEKREDSMFAGGVIHEKVITLHTLVGVLPGKLRGSATMKSGEGVSHQPLHSPLKCYRQAQAHKPQTTGD